MSTKTQICNGALILLGQEAALVDVDTDDSVRGGDFRAVWDTCLDAALRAHPWNFALDFASLGSDTVAAADLKFGFARRYTWPANPHALRIWRLSPDYHGLNPVWKPLERFIYTDEGSPIYVEFIKRVDNPGLFDPQFVTLLELLLAAKTAFKITGALSTSEAMEERAAKFRPSATAIDSQESGADWPDDGEFLESRLG